MSHKGRKDTGREADPLDAAPTVVLLSRVLDEAKDLVRIEVELAREDVRSEVKGLSHGAIGFGVAAALVLLALDLLVLALVLALGGMPWLALALAGAFAVLGAVAAGAGYASLPKKPLEPTRRRLASDVDPLSTHGHDRHSLLVRRADVRVARLTRLVDALNRRRHCLARDAERIALTGAAVLGSLAAALVTGLVFAALYAGRLQKRGRMAHRMARWLEQHA